MILPDLSLKNNEIVGNTDKDLVTKLSEFMNLVKICAAQPTPINPTLYEEML